MVSATLQGVETFNRMCLDLAKFGGPGSTVESVFRGEVGHLLETCIRYTPTARAQYIEQRTTFRERRQYGSYSAGATGKEAKAQPSFIVAGQKNEKKWAVGFNVTGRATARYGRQRDRFGNVSHAWHRMDAGSNRRWSDERFQAWQREEADRLEDYRVHLAKELKLSQGSRGLAAQSWLDIADALGVDVKVAGFIRRATPSNGRKYLNGAGTVTDDPTGTTYLLQNFQPILLKTGGEDIVERAIATRARAFDIAVERGALDDVKFLASRYPALLGP